MAPGLLLRATLPIRSMSSQMSLTRSTILLSTSSISQFIRPISSISTKPTETPLSTPQETSPDFKASSLLPPPKLRDYTYRLKTGTVVSVGRMQRTVTVSYRHTTWDKRIRKYYPAETRYLVSDPRDSLREGDVIEFASGAPKSRRVHHVVERIITPFGSPIEDRPAVMSREERHSERERHWAEKHLRRESKRLGREIDLVAQSPGNYGASGGLESEKPMSTPKLMRRLHPRKQVGKLKALVERRLAEHKAEERARLRSQRRSAH